MYNYYLSIEKLTKEDNLLTKSYFRNTNVYLDFKYSTVYIKGLPLVYTDKTEEDTHSCKYDDCKFLIRNSGKIERERILSYLPAKEVDTLININKSSLAKLEELKKLKVVDLTVTGKVSCICETCGRRFRTKNTIDLFCSQECANKSTTIKKGSKFKSNSIRIVCTVCGIREYREDFKRETSKYEKINYCCSSAVCQDVMRNEVRDITVYKKDCEICGKTFIARQKSNITCSSICKKASEKSNPAAYHIKRCQTCGKQYKTRNLYSYTCSIPCNKEYVSSEKTKAYEEFM